MTERGKDNKSKVLRQSSPLANEIKALVTKKKNRTINVFLLGLLFIMSLKNVFTTAQNMIDDITTVTSLVVRLAL
tara:strand:+ start:13108 stop:13332 length:225 start_codon:yes stop_codon:yes gene_type:complete